MSLQRKLDRFTEKNLQDDDVVYVWLQDMLSKLKLDSFYFDIKEKDK